MVLVEGGNLIDLAIGSLDSVLEGVVNTSPVKKILTKLHDLARSCNFVRIFVDRTSSMLAERILGLPRVVSAGQVEWCKVEPPCLLAQ